MGWTHSNNYWPDHSPPAVWELPPREIQCGKCQAVKTEGDGCEIEGCPCWAVYEHAADADLANPGKPLNADELPLHAHGVPGLDTDQSKGGA